VTRRLRFVKNHGHANASNTLMPYAARMVVVLLALTSMAAAQPQGFARVPLIRSEKLDVFLQYLPVASPADEQFIGFALVNKTGAPLAVGGATAYRLDDARTFERGTDKLLGTGALASGNSYDLLHRDVVKPNTTQPPLPPGESLRLGYASSYSLAVAGYLEPGSPGHTIKAVAKLTVELDGKTLSTPEGGVPFQFDWLPPPESATPALRDRLRRLVRSGDPGQRHYYAMALLLDRPLYADALTPDDLITGLRAYEQSGDKLLGYIEDHRPLGDALVNYALDLIRARDHLRMLVLCRSKSLRDARLVQPLLEWFREDPQMRPGGESALQLLSNQIDLAPDRDALTAELGRIALTRCPIVSSGGPVTAEAGWKFQSELRLLTLTHDRTLATRLIRYLDDRTVAIDAKRLSTPNPGVSTRVCDLTYNAIVDLVGRDGERFEISSDFRRPTTQPATAAAEYARRDALIATLRQELATKR
jgi:hypothetical protein